MRRVWLKLNTVHGLSNEGLEEGISDLGDEVQWAQVQGAGIDRFYLVGRSGMLDENDTPADLAALYDVRAFGPAVELHAVRRGDTWDAVVATESSSKSDGAIELEACSYQSIVWGEASSGTSHAEGWTLMGSAQVGKIAVPVETSDRAILETIEYRDHTDHGNAYLRYSRLGAIKPARGEEGTSDA